MMKKRKKKCQIAKNCYCLQKITRTTSINNKKIIIIASQQPFPLSPMNFLYSVKDKLLIQEKIVKLFEVDTFSKANFGWIFYTKPNQTKFRI